MPTDYRAMIPTLSFRNQAFINGKYVAAASGKTFDCVSPIDGRVLTKVAECDVEDVNRAVAAARAVFEKGSWSACHPGKRKKVMLKFAELMAEAQGRAGAARNARHGKAHLGLGGRRHSGLDPGHPVVCGGRRQGL